MPDSTFTARFSLPNTNGETADVTGVVSSNGRVWARISVPSAVPDDNFGYVSVEGSSSTGSVFAWTSFVVNKVPFVAAPVPTLVVPSTLGIGAVFGVSLGLWDPQPTTLSYQWLRDGAPISGATSATYAVSANDQSSQLSLRVTSARAGYDSTGRSTTSVAIGTFPATAENVSGTVLSASTGEPLADVTVRLRADDDFAFSAPLATTSSGGDGTYRFDEVEPGSYLVEIDDPSGTYATVWSGGAFWRDLATPVIVGFGGGALDSVELPLVGSIGGSLTDAVTLEGLPYESVVVARAEDGVVVVQSGTGVDGHFTIGDLPPGDYLVNAPAYWWSGSATPARQSEWWQNAYRSADATPINLVGGQAVTGIDIDLESAATVSGTVRDERGEPIEGVDVFGYASASDNYPVSYGVTDADGRYTMPQVPAGSMFLEFRPFSAVYGVGSQFGGGLPFQIAWNGGATGRSLAIPFDVVPAEVIENVDVVLPDNDPDIPPAGAPIVSYEASTDSFTWSEPASTLPLIEYNVLHFSVREGGGESVPAVNERRFPYSVLLGDNPTMTITRALTANGIGAPRIFAVNPPGSAPAPSVTVSNRATQSFDLTVTAPNNWQGGRWAVSVYETAGDVERNLLSWESGPAPRTVTVTVDGLEPDTDYTIIAAVDNQEDHSETYQHSSWSVTSTRTLDPNPTQPFTAAPNPTFSAPVQIGVGATVTAATGTWSPGPTSFAYQWLRNGSLISGATSATYALTNDDEFTSLSVRVTATRAGYATTQRTSAALSLGGFSTPPPVGVEVGRIGGATRYDVAALISEENFEPGVATVFIASGENFPDAISAAPAAASSGVPVLLVGRSTLPEPIRDELVRLQPQRIVVVGGPNSIDPSVYAQLAELTTSIQRIGGADRFAVSTALARLQFIDTGASQMFIATGNVFADALSAAPAASAAGAPMILVGNGETALRADIQQLIADLGVTRVSIAGGPASVNPGLEASLVTLLGRDNVVRYTGPDRFAVSVGVNTAAFPTASQVYIASGITFPDALAGAAIAGPARAPLFIVPGACMPAAVSEYIRESGATRMTILGGPVSVSTDVEGFRTC